MFVVQRIDLPGGCADPVIIDRLDARAELVGPVGAADGAVDVVPVHPGVGGFIGDAVELPVIKIADDSWLPDDSAV